MPAYLDHNATTPVRPEAAAAVAEALASVGNPSSVHGFGRAARRRVEEAREAVARLVGAAPGGVIFTSGGTEANALALSGAVRVLVSAVEHDAVRLASPGAETVPVDAEGVIRLEALQAMLAEDRRPTVVAVMLANNETGVIQPVAQVAEIARRFGARFHCDAVQAAGKVTVDLASIGAHSLALSAHKLGGPQGVGALVLADGDDDVVPLVKGGGQEKSRRAGTENVPGIAGFGTAAALAGGLGHLAAWRDRIEARARALRPDLVVAGVGAKRLPNTTCLALPDLAAQTQVMRLDLAGVAVSAGSACSSGKVKPSHVLAAMGLEDALVKGAIRVSLGWSTTAAEVEEFVAAWSAMAAPNAKSNAA